MATRAHTTSRSSPGSATPADIVPPGHIKAPPPSLEISSVPDQGVTRPAPTNFVVASLTDTGDGKACNCRESRQFPGSEGRTNFVRASLTGSAASHPDAAILDLAARIAAWDEISSAAFARAEAMGRGSAREAAFRAVFALTEEWHVLTREMAALRARTHEGMVAKARIQWPLLNIGINDDMDAVHDDDVLAWSICRDLLEA